MTVFRRTLEACVGSVRTQHRHGSARQLLPNAWEPDFLTPQALSTEFRNKVVHRGYLPSRQEVDAYAAKIFALIDRLLTELGDASEHAELAQEQVFARQLLKLPEGVHAVFEAHPGMFRARRFTTQIASKTTPSKSMAPPLNDAQIFAQALQERAPWLDWFKRQ